MTENHLFHLKMARIDTLLTRRKVNSIHTLYISKDNTSIPDAKIPMAVEFNSSLQSATGSKNH
jgi:hypothetical protein